jgi:hypothetical protein
VPDFYQQLSVFVGFQQDEAFLALPPGVVWLVDKPAGIQDVMPVLVDDLGPYRRVSGTEAPDLFISRLLQDVVDDFQQRDKTNLRIGVEILLEDLPDRLVQ